MFALLESSSLGGVGDSFHFLCRLLQVDSGTACGKFTESLCYSAYTAGNSTPRGGQPITCAGLHQGPHYLDEDRASVALGPGLRSFLSLQHIPYARYKTYDLNTIMPL